MKLTDDLMFRYVDTDLTEEEIDKLTKENWKELYLYMVKRDKSFKKGILSTMGELAK